MAATLGRSGKLLLGAILCISPFVVHHAVTTGRGTTAAALLSGLDIAVMGILLTLRSIEKWRWAAVGITVSVLLMLMFWWHVSQGNFLAASGIPHAVIYVGLLIFFGQTLVSGREALITSIVAKIYGRPLPDDVALYTRRVTIAWCIFFALQLLLSSLLFVFASMSVWSLFVNVLNFPLLILMFALEYFYRVWRLPKRPRSNVSDVIHAFMHNTTSGIGRPGPNYRSP